MSHSRMPTHCTLHAFSPQHHPLKNDLNIHIEHGHQSTIQRQLLIRSLFLCIKVIPLYSRLRNVSHWLYKRPKRLYISPTFGFRYPKCIRFPGMWENLPNYKKSVKFCIQEYYAWYYYVLCGKISIF